MAGSKFSFRTSKSAKIIPVINMQAVILAAGKSGRLYPFNTFHKSLINVLGKPIISHTIASVKKAGITDIILVSEPNNNFVEILGNGKKLGVKITYAFQKKPEGMGNALLSAAHLIKSDFFLLHPYRAEFAELKEEIDKLRGTNKNAILLTQKEKNLSLYGALILEGETVVGVVEKPKKGEVSSDLRIVGMCFLNQDFIKTLRSVRPHHYNFESALDVFAKNGRVKAAVTQKETITLKYPWDLLGIKNYFFKKLKRHISKKAEISKQAKIIGEVFIEDGVVISENAIVKGPVYIGKNSFIGTNALVRHGVDIEKNAIIGGFSEVKNSLIQEASSAHSGLIEDSIIGKNCKIGALFATANVRLDRANIKVQVKQEKIDTGLKHLGAMIGDNCIFASRVSIMPGVIVGNNVSIGPSTTVMKNIPSDSIFYTKFSEIVQKNKSSKTNKDLF
ncbi:MAG: Bifunctional protein GlmU [Candidatus Levybacteria bacterium GW2011_GWA2_40_16]|nr:MAG: Bifunctional protein GlmU [Candidatus Levybacteria bacterium GW2011_GWA2_40_16]